MMANKPHGWLEMSVPDMADTLAFISDHDEEVLCEIIERLVAVHGTLAIRRILDEIELKAGCDD
jgi:hypothetical protein